MAKLIIIAIFLNFLIGTIMVDDMNKENEEQVEKIWDFLEEGDDDDEDDEDDEGCDEDDEDTTGCGGGGDVLHCPDAVRDGSCTSDRDNGDATKCSPKDEERDNRLFYL